MSVLTKDQQRELLMPTGRHARNNKYVSTSAFAGGIQSKKSSYMSLCMLLAAPAV